MSTKHTFTALTLALSIILGGLSQSDSQKYNRIEILPSDQRSGDPEAGFNYLVNGAYVHSGIPFDAFGSFLPKDSTNILNREGQSAYVTPTFNLTEHDNGVKLLTPNCLTCHADKINGEFIVGLGNNSFDYTINTNAMTNMLSMVIKQRFTEASKEWEAFEAFHKSSSALSDNITTKVRGINPADKLTSVLVAHRDNQTLEWLDKPALEIPEKTIPTDVPAWWLLKKKNAMFSTGIGRGDFSRFLMASSLLTLKDSSEAAQIDKQFPDVLAWINTIEPPKYPKDINHELAQKGKKLFDLNCSSCHGTYGKDESYPNLLISLEEVGTDPELSKAYTDGLYSNFVNWYEDSWFAKGSHPGKIVIEPGYVAPPLDGVWATAPYFHNGSVPQIEAVLNSKIRPTYWSRTFDSHDYNYEKLGWNYQRQESKNDNQTYDTSLEAYGNTGHTFGDDLTQDERMAVIEYLKTI